MDLFAPLSVEEFRRDVLGRDFRVWRGASGRFAALLSHEAVLETVGRGLEPTLVTVVKDGREIPRERFCAVVEGRARVHRGMVEALLSGGAALITAQMHRAHRPLWDLARELEGVFRAAVNVNVYAGGPRSRGFDLHVDHHDVVVLQVSGRKSWSVARATGSAPLVVPDHNGPAPTQMTWEGTLESGDVMYLPRGTWHRAEATAESPTLHLSCGVQPCTGLHAARWLCDELMSDPRFRAELPRFGAPGTLREQGLALRELFMQCWGDDLVERFVNFHDARLEREASEMEKSLWPKRSR